MTFLIAPTTGTIATSGFPLLAAEKATRPVAPFIKGAAPEDERPRSGWYLHDLPNSCGGCIPSSRTIQSEFAYSLYESCYDREGVFGVIFFHEIRPAIVVDGRTGCSNVQASDT